VPEILPSLNTNKLIITAAIFLGTAFIVGHVSYRLFAFMPLVMMLAICVYWAAHRKIDGAFHKPIIWGSIGLITLSLTSVIWSEFHDVSIERISKITPVILAGAICVCFFSKNTVFATTHIRQIFFYAWLIGMLIMFIDLIFPAPIYSAFRDADLGELRPQLNRYVLALFIGYLFIIANTSFKISALLSIPVASILILNWSQSAQLSAIFIVILFAGWPFLKKYAIYITGAGITLTTLIFPWAVKWGWANRPESLGDIGDKAAAFHRLEIWDGIATKILQNPLLGYGLENIRETSLDIEHVFWEYDKILHPHSYSLQLWVEFGLIGVFLFLAWLWYGLLKLRHLSMSDQKLALSLIVFIFGINLSAYGLWQGWWLGLCLLTWSGFYIFRSPQNKLSDS
jgi:O-antigen ligase